MNEVMGVLDQATAADYAAVQARVQDEWLRQQAFTLALQAAGNTPRSVDQLIGDAERIMAWMRPAEKSTAN